MHAGAPQVVNAQSWPAARPYDATWLDGWGVHRRAWSTVLAGIVAPVVIEVGAWMGRTSAFLLDEFVDLQLVAIDLWSPDGFWRARMDDAHTSGALPEGNVDPLRQYQTNQWQRRQRVTCIQAESLHGLHHAADSAPDVVYIDADHAYDKARPDIDAACILFPDAVICGDDYEERLEADGGTGVKRAVHDVADRRGLSVSTAGRWWRYD